MCVWKAWLNLCAKVSVEAMRRSRVLITDDHALLAEGIAALIRPEYDVVGFASDGRQMVAEAERLRPDLITLDIGMPGLNGLEAAKQVRKVLPAVKLVFVTQQVDLRYLQAALSAGGKGFVAKQSASTELLGALAKVLRGQRFITPLLEEEYEQRELESRGAKSDKLSEPLTPRQREVLQLLAEGQSNRQIAAKLNISQKTVEFHRSAIMGNLGIRTTAELTRYAMSEDCKHLAAACRGRGVTRGGDPAAEVTGCCGAPRLAGCRAR